LLGPCADWELGLFKGARLDVIILAGKLMVKFKHIQTSPGLDVILLVLLAAKLHSFSKKMLVSSP